LIRRRELEQRANIKVLVKFGKSGSEIEMLLQVYGDNGMKKRAVYKWVTRFSEGRESVTDEESSGRTAVELKKKLQTFDKFCVKIVC
jgi:transposase